MKLSFVCPCYNEEKNVAEFLRLIYEVFPDTYNYEVIFVDDGSKDATLEQLKKLKSASPQNIKIISFSRNFGKEAAIYAGLQHSKGDFVSIIDTDLQQKPQTVKEMLAVLESNPDADCVCACQTQRKENAVSRFFKKAFYKVADKFTDIEFVDGASDFRTFRARVRDAILSLGEYNRFSKGIFSWVGFKTIYIPYTADERKNGKSSFSFLKLFKYGINGILSFTTAPLKFASYVGSAAILFSFIYMIITVIRKLASNIDADGFTQLVILVAFLGGIQLFCIGIIGEYLAKNYIEAKHRPIYIAKEILSYTNEDK